MEEGSSNENPSPIVNLDLSMEEDEKQSDLSTMLIVASQVFSTNPRDAIKELKKEMEKANLLVMFVEMGLDPANFEDQIANDVEQQN